MDRIIEALKTETNTIVTKVFYERGEYYIVVREGEDKRTKLKAVAKGNSLEAAIQNILEEIANGEL